MVAFFRSSSTTLLVCRFAFVTVLDVSRPKGSREGLDGVDVCRGSAVGAAGVGRGSVSGITVESRVLLFTLAFFIGKADSKSD